MIGKVKQFMSKTVVTVRENMLLEECEELFTKKGITGAPVVNQLEELVGVVSRTDFGKKRYEEGNPRLGEEGFQEYEELLGVKLEDGFKIEEKYPGFVADIMSRKPIVCEPEDSVVVAAQKMNQNHVHRVIVVEDRRVVGVISSMDIVKMVCGTAKSWTSAAPRLKKK